MSARLKTLQQLLSASPFQACLISHPPLLLYYTGAELSGSRLLVSPQQCTLFTSKRDLHQAEQIMETQIASAATLKGWLLKQQPQGALVFDSTALSYAQGVQLREDLTDSGWQLSMAPEFFAPLRAVKDAGELRALRRSADILKRGFVFVETQLRVGVSERDLARAFELFVLQQGAEALAFKPTIAFGPHSAFPHHRAGGATLKQGDVVLLDLGVVYEGYCSDCTRVLFFEGEDSELLSFYHLVKQAQAAALTACRPGNTIAAVEGAARAALRAAGVEELFCHGLGHGVGLEIHEFPSFTQKETLLQPGMVLTIEPGLYLPGKGGVRYEDTLVITHSGYEILT